jgi:hypothetical protein
VYLSLLCRFHLSRAYEAYPVQLIGTAACTALLISILAAWGTVQRQACNLAVEKRALLQKGPTAPQTKPADVAAIELPPLQSAEIVKTFNNIAEDLHVPLEEVAYSLDNADRTPYLKYRITLTTKVGYSEIRKFLAVVSSEMPNATLDNIRCSRTDPAAPVLGCELVFSAFFSKAEHG